MEIIFIILGIAIGLILSGILIITIGEYFSKFNSFYDDENDD